MILSLTVDHQESLEQVLNQLIVLLNQYDRLCSPMRRYFLKERKCDHLPSCKTQLEKIHSISKFGFLVLSKDRDNRRHSFQIIFSNHSDKEISCIKLHKYEFLISNLGFSIKAFYILQLNVFTLRLALL